MSDLDFSDSLKDKPTLTNCDREPIHIPGSIQPHGYLLAIKPTTGQIVAASENCAGFTNAPVEDILGTVLEELSPELNELLHAQLNSTTQSGPRRTPFHWNNRSWTISVSGDTGLAILEIEFQDTIDVKVSDLVGELFVEFERLELQQAYQRVVERVKDFTGFDRVMLYQFLEDGHGHVIAEAKEDEQEAFLGLHYPATDIPEPARRLYKLNWIRTIADVNSEPVPLRYASDYSGPLDMSHVNLRAISPIHIEYLKNMQVGASMSISVMHGDQLWGLIACHHNSEKIIPPELRDACELCGSLLSVYLTSRHQQEHLRRQMEINETINEHVASLSRTQELSEGLEQSAEPLCTILAADGLVWISGTQRFDWGVIPEQNMIDLLVETVSQQVDQTICFTDQLRSWLPPDFVNQGTLAGMLSIRLGEELGGLFLFFRKALPETITWAGNPDKSVTNESGRLTPRKSFAAWKQLVEDRSKPWSLEDREAAHSLVNGLQRILVAQSEKLRAVNEELRRLNADLDAFAYAASHDLKEPLRGIYQYVYLLEKASSTFAEENEPYMQGLKRIVKRMSDLLDGLLRFSRAGRADLHLEKFSLNEVMEQVKDLLFAGRQPEDVIVEIEQSGTVRGDFSCTREILTNLIRNAIKYNDSSTKRITISLLPLKETPLNALIEKDEPIICVRDNGIGIPADQYQKIFDIFYRLHDRDAYGGGSGAGLTIVRRMVERHGGIITVDSGREGTAFYFTLGTHE